jgi:general secretion pathway protein H
MLVESAPGREWNDVMRRGDESGFTLIELMVVLVIIGLAATAVILAMPEPGGSVESEAERFAARAKAARDSAIVEARPVALNVDASGYAVVRRSDGQWRSAAQYEWSQGTEAEARGTLEGGTRFDSTGLAEPLRLILSRRGRQVAVDIGQDGEVHVRR